MQAGEVGIRIRVDAIIDLTGTTARELIVCGPKDATPRALSMTIDTPPNFAIRTTVATDFPDPGNYFIQLKATFADGRILKSPLKLLHVGVMIL